MIGALLVLTLAVVLGALLRCLDPAAHRLRPPPHRRVRPKTLLVHGRPVDLVPLEGFRVLENDTPLAVLYLTVLLEGMLLRPAPETWREATDRLRREAREGKLGGESAPPATPPPWGRRMTPRHPAQHHLYWADQRRRIHGIAD